jgi:hypothetical protein
MAKTLTRKQMIETLDRHEKHLLTVQAVLPGMVLETQRMKAKVEGRDAEKKESGK